MISAAAPQEEVDMAIKRILVPVDFSDDSRNALAYARDFAKPLGAELSLLHVVEPIYYATPADMYVASPNVAMLLDEQRRLATKHLQRIAADLKKKGQRVRAAVKTGAPSQVIIDSTRGADLIIMGTHGRTGLVHMLMGSVAEKVVRGANCPVLTLRHAAAKKARKKRPAKKQ
jgi:universal stress protein A